jgi:hypothetical protein
MTPEPFTETKAAPQVQCDLCDWPMPTPDHCVEIGEILGMLVCSQCAEDTLEGAVNTGATLALVGGSH